MAWIELHQSVWTHRKTLLLASKLGIKPTYAAAHMARLWCWAVDNAPEGDLTGLPADVIAYGADWSGDPQQFVAAATEAGYFEQTPDGRLAIRNWHLYAGRLIERREAERERTRRRRQHSLDVAATSAGCPPDVRATSAGCPPDVRATSAGTLPNHTVPNHTEHTEPCSSVTLVRKRDEREKREREERERGERGERGERENCARASRSPSSLPPSPSLSPASPFEQQLLSTLQSVAGYPFDANKDLQFIRQLAEDFPDVDLLAEAKAWRTYKLDRPLEKRSNARSQFRNWVAKARQFRSRDAPGRTSARNDDDQSRNPIYRDLTEEALREATEIGLLDEEDEL